MNRSLRRLCRLLSLLIVAFACAGAEPSFNVVHGGRPLLDAHNCYPDGGRWADRLDRALSTGMPLGIEQDLIWYIEPGTGKGRSIVSHGAPYTGKEPGLREHFFHRVSHTMKAEIDKGDRSKWPLIVLHFDFKSSEPEHLQEIWSLLGEYEEWITTAVKGADASALSPLELKPLLVLTEDNDAHQAAFYDKLPFGAKLRIFGSAKTNGSAFREAKTSEERAKVAARTDPAVLLTERPTNYRRWWNASWAIVEEGGQPKSGDWTKADDERLRAIVDHAHRLGFWIRFYTLNGHAAGESKGWSASYNFGSEDAVRARWRAAIAAGVNLIATDQFEGLAEILGKAR